MVFVRRASAIFTMALAVCFSLPAQSRFFAGAMGGVCTLSADNKSIIQAVGSNSSAYKPDNGTTLDVFAGVHWNDYLSSELDYFWNRNATALTSLQTSPAAFYRQKFSTRQNSALISMLLYFRGRSSCVRPYLSVGTGVVALSSLPDGVLTASALRPPPAFSSSALAFHVAVGIDVRLHRGFAFRYSFAETTQPNPISERLNPPGDRRLASFRNLFGFVQNF